ncbi:MAG: 8-oxo-dGTP diphosphatase [Gemmataceae bacterium]
MPYTPILATLGYVFSPDRTRILMVHRTARPDDFHFGKWNGLGGKLNPNEDIISGIRREIREEAGIECCRIQLAGTISWPGFGKNGEDWFGFLFRILSWSGTVLPSSPEGPLEWVDIEKVAGLNLWEGDRSFLPYVLNLNSLPFHGIMPYLVGRPVSWEFQHENAENEI